MRWLCQSTLKDYRDVVNVGKTIAIKKHRKM